MTGNEELMLVNNVHCSSSREPHQLTRNDSLCCFLLIQEMMAQTERQSCRNQGS